MQPRNDKFSPFAGQARARRHSPGGRRATRWGPRAERPGAAVAFNQVVRTVEPEVPAGWFVVADGEVDGLGNGAEQMLGVQRLAGPGPAPVML